MFFKKKLPIQKPIVVPTPSPAWPEPDRSTQELAIRICRWQYNVTPTRRVQYDETWSFSFEGQGITPPLDGVPAIGSIEVLEPSDSIGVLEDQWKVVPEKLEGYCFLMESDAPILDPDVAIHLLCKSSALDSIYRAFNIAAISQAPDFLIKMLVDCPNNSTNNFWEEQWRHEWLRILRWQLFAGARVRLES